MALPAHLPGRLPAGLCVFGLTHACGMTWSGTPKANPSPLTARQVIDLAAESGLSWVEMPLAMLGSEPEVLRDLGVHAEAQGIRFVVPGGKVSVEELRQGLGVARALGAPTLRCTLSGVLCGDRRGFPGGWQSHVDRCIDVLEQVLPEAERSRVAIAVENHQDADSEDLLRICRRFGSRWLGVTLDCANPLAVMEEPVAFAERLAPYLRHAHLKDYTIHPAPEGFRLVRCALGQGVIDFPGLFRIFESQEWPITRNIEMAALQARTIPFLEASWWDEYAPRDVRQALPALELVWRSLRPAGEEWRTPFERDAPAEELADYEWEQYRASVDYLRLNVIRR
jgi:3-oxoisoapionate decarboxylase